MNRPYSLPFSSFSILIVFLLLSLTGISVLPLLTIQLSPGKSEQGLTVWCNASGTSAEEIELELTSVIEASLSTLSGIREINSTSGSNYCLIEIKLDKWTDPELFNFEAAAILRRLYPQLPKIAAYPQLYLNRPESNDSQKGIIGFTVNGPGSLREIYQVTEEKIRPALTAIKGISSIEITGPDNDNLFIAPDEKALKASGISLAAFKEALTNGLTGYQAGLMHSGTAKVNLYVSGSIQRQEDLAAFPVSKNGGRIIRVGEVANFSRGSQQSFSGLRLNGQEIVHINIFPDAHINTVQLISQINRVLKASAIDLPAGYQVSQIFNNNQELDQELHKIYFRTVLSLVILLVFVLLISRQPHYLLIVLAALLANISIAFIFYYLLRLEIQLYSLAGITISLGMVVDNAVLLIEDSNQAGKNRIFSAILASTFTALGALCVIFLLDGAHQVFLLDFASAIIINLLVSIPIAYFLIPALLHAYGFKLQKRTIYFKRKRLSVSLTKRYRQQLKFLLRFRWQALLCCVLAFGMPVFLLPGNFSGNNKLIQLYNAIFDSEFYSGTLRGPVNTYLGGSLYLLISHMASHPPENSKSEKTELKVSINLPNGSNLQQVNAITVDFEKYLSMYPRQIELFSTEITNANHALITISFKKGFEDHFAYQLKKKLEARALLSGAADFQIYGVGKGFNNHIDQESYDSSIILKGYNYKKLRDIALTVRDSLLKNPRIQDALVSTRGIYDAKPVQEYAAHLWGAREQHFSPFDRRNLDQLLQSRNEHYYTAGLLPDKTGVPKAVVVAVNRDNPPTVWSLMQDPIMLNDSVHSRLKDLSTIRPVKFSDDIIRQNQEYVLNVHYKFIGPYELNQLINRKLVERFKKILPFGYRIESVSGNNWIVSQGYSYLWLIPLVLFIIYIICAILLESIVQPLAVIAMIPFCFIGVFLIFYLLNISFDEGGYAALLMVSALVTNTSLYVINDMNFFRAARRMKMKGNCLDDYLKAFQSKIVPIAITTLSAILSLLPFMVNGEENGFWFTLSAGTIGGLFFSLLGICLVLPLLLLKKQQND